MLRGIYMMSQRAVNALSSACEWEKTTNHDPRSGEEIMADFLKKGVSYWLMPLDGSLKAAEDPDYWLKPYNGEGLTAVDESGYVVPASPDEKHHIVLFYAQKEWPDNYGSRYKGARMTWTEYGHHTYNAVEEHWNYMSAVALADTPLEYGALTFNEAKKAVYDWLDSFDGRPIFHKI